MKPFIGDSNNNNSVRDFQIREELISKLKNRFTTYGYKQIRTSTFEYYDLYSSITGTVNPDDMIKVVDSTGKVLVLRPDVTIPITRMAASNKQSASDKSRYFYVLDVFRQSYEKNTQKESTQAGIEYLGNNSAEIDAEVIMLAIHTLKDIGFSNFKIEIGHAGFFKELITQAALSSSELAHLQTLIQSKNTAEIDPFLAELSIPESLRAAISVIPMMYGDPKLVIEQAKMNCMNENMQSKLQNLIDVFEVLKDYGADDSIVFNLGLINNMNYYSDIIFQGFIEQVGKPVLMGGRYDNLSKQYGTPLPAVGFAFEVDLMLDALLQQGLSTEEDMQVDIIIYYVKQKQRDALETAYILRDRGYQVLTFSTDSHNQNSVSAVWTIRYETNQELLSSATSNQLLSDSHELLRLFPGTKEDL
ncbi:ATP phosphoribosyltransferase regulatory subunit [Virgibacillus sp. C22-A2]|uniref:ATP phosphoribosyltransferase regulatory subunit n=1 Tax=Virgibacillus tibetensis TaxID=3042313 RepID=A0ABU6KIA8_9BACI|nr:ATP phosphoribosyltransferase regulatory subunit [Virgibacillus sp. C22-A2]